MTFSLKNTIYSIGGISPIKEICRRWNGLAGILCYHSVLPDNELINFEGPYTTLSIKEELFDEHIYSISKNETVVSMDEMYEHLVSSSQAFVVAITFDDGYKDNLTYALPILEKYNIPATIYITTAFPEGNTWIWWFELWDYIRDQNHVSLNYNNEHHEWKTSKSKKKYKCFNDLSLLFTSLNKEKQQNILEILTQTSKRKMYPELCLDWNEIKILDKSPLVTIGAHTHSHQNLSLLTKKEVSLEMVTSKQILEKELNHQIDHLAYPYGTLNEAKIREYDLAKEHGFKTSVTTIPNSNQAIAMNAIPRLGIPYNLNALGLQGKLSGWEYFLRKINNSI